MPIFFQLFIQPSKLRCADFLRLLCGHHSLRLQKRDKTTSRNLSKTVLIDCSKLQYKGKPACSFRGNSNGNFSGARLERPCEGGGSSVAGIAHSVLRVSEVRVRLMSLSQIHQFSLVLWNVFLDRYLCETGSLSVDFSLKIVISQVFAVPSCSGGCSRGLHPSFVEFVSV